MFERIIHIQLQEYLNRKNLLAEQQDGFRLIIQRNTLQIN